MQLTLGVFAFVGMVISASFAEQESNTIDDKWKANIVGAWEYQYGENVLEEDNYEGFTGTMNKLLFAKGSDFIYNKTNDNLYSETIRSKATGTITRVFVPGQEFGLSWEYADKKVEVAITYTYEGHGTWKQEVVGFDHVTGKSHTAAIYKTAKEATMTWKFEANGKKAGTAVLRKIAPEQKHPL